MVILTKTLQVCKDMLGTKMLFWLVLDRAQYDYWCIFSVFCFIFCLFGERG